MLYTSNQLGINSLWWQNADLSGTAELVQRASETVKIYVQPFPPTGAKHPVTADGGRQPVWSRDGRRIFYVRNNQLWAATIRTFPAFAVTSQDTVFSGDYLLNAPTHASYDTSPDSSGFVLLRTGGIPPRIVVVQDWRYELRQRILAARKK